MDYSISTDSQVLEDLCDKLKQRRLNLNLTQNHLAEESGLHLQTIKKLEAGRTVSLLTLIKVLRAYGDLNSLEVLLPEIGVSPMELLKLKGKQRKRASKKK
ncbi:MAG: transcriptional regulator with XRE-family HTH domain [Parvicellaceae bacterium]|jgi:transcriptional regulator with XRE-family HTH domain